MDGGYPPFSLDKPRFDSGTYFGRCRHFLNVINPANLFVSEATLKQSTKMLEDFQAGVRTPEMTDKSLWKALEMKNVVLHPDTGQLIPAPFRMAAFLPVNIPIAFGMIMSSPTLVNIVGWQWINQTYNVCVNYANRNATLDMSTQDLMTAYGVATGTSVGIAVGLNQWLKNAKLSSFARSVASKAVPFFAVASAGAANVSLIRYKEVQDGIDVEDEHGKSYGKSKKAGFSAVSQVALTRVILPAPILLLPTFFVQGIEKAKLMPSGRFGKIAVELTAISLSILIGLPAAIGLFPQRASIAAESLEPEFQDIKDANGRAIKTFYFNKGL